MCLHTDTHLTQSYQKEKSTNMNVLEDLMKYKELLMTITTVRSTGEPSTRDLQLGLKRNSFVFSLYHPPSVSFIYEDAKTAKWSTMNRLTLFFTRCTRGFG